jgi:hypothetical protein
MDFSFRLRRGTQALPGTLAYISIANLVAGAMFAFAFAMEDRIAHYLKTGSAAGR